MTVVFWLLLIGVVVLIVLIDNAPKARQREAVDVGEYELQCCGQQRRSRDVLLEAEKYRDRLVELYDEIIATEGWEHDSPEATEIYYSVLNGDVNDVSRTLLRGEHIRH